ncbi:hypothetical protein [Robertkochia solimangrovi]|uniref:hypothetical protein n=1 Tax=Robertkochia solimangrovi TaxID=2213046 RepID=UPI001180A6B3|nr:hypothetical protein [Robertkochia solimangrovi]TRZ41391.1 hypothetical protein DMZ48_17045 [Robertkochia solimangrovi]
MKSEKDFCILSVKYEIIDASGTSEKTVETTEMEHVFVAKKKSRVLKKIRKFEEKLHGTEMKQSTYPGSALIERCRHFVNNYRSSYNRLLRL